MDGDGDDAGMGVETGMGTFDGDWTLMHAPSACKACSVSNP